MRRRRGNEDPTTSRRTRLRGETKALNAESNDKRFAVSGPLVRLPWLCVGETVVSFLAPPPRFAVRQPEGLDLQRYRTQLASLPYVCRHWNRLAESIAEAFRKQIYSLEITNDTNSSSQVRGLTKAVGELVVQLQCSAQYPKRPTVPLMVPRSALPPDRLTRVNWKSVLSIFSSVVRLDLFNVCLSLVDKVLDAASTVCPHVEILILPYKQSSTFNELLTSERFTGHLVAALSAWHTSNGGLRGLCIPQWPSEPNGQYNRLLSAVTTYCPQLEYLHGWHTQHPSGLLIRSQLGNVETHVWKMFCERCSRLREFSWRLAPLSAAFVEQFRRTEKSMLRELCVDDTLSIASDPADISSLQTLFPALPGLTLLSLWMPNYCNLTAQQVRPQTGSLDDLVESVVRHCPQLESFRCFFPRSVEPTNVVSCETLVQLVKQRAAREVVVSPVLLPRYSLRNMLVAIIAENKRRFCTVELMAVRSVHAVIHELLQLLESDNKINLTHLRFHLSVSTPDGDANALDCDGIPVMTGRDLAVCVAAIKVKYADSITRFEVTTQPLGGRMEGVFSGVELQINVP